MQIPCVLDFDEKSDTVTILHGKTGCIQMIIRLEAAGVGTMTRITPDTDCDNYWIGVKPADSVVFNDKLFDRKNTLVIRSIDFALEKKIDYSKTRY